MNLDSKGFCINPEGVTYGRDYRCPCRPRAYHPGRGERSDERQRLLVALRRGWRREHKGKTNFRSIAAACSALRKFAWLYSYKEIVLDGCIQSSH